MEISLMEKPAPLLARPIKQQASPHKQKNMFEYLRSSDPLPAIHKIRGKSYDFVGSREFKGKYVEEQRPISVTKRYEDDQKFQQTENIEGTNLINTMNTTINRKTIMSKMSKDQTNLVTKQSRQLKKYKEYQQYWENQSRKLHERSMRRQNDKTLLENNVKQVYVHPNDDRIDIINNNVVRLWEMSLRNNNKILQGHIKGNKYAQNELEQKLQTSRGIKQVQKSIPVLPMQQLKNVTKRDLSLSGRNRALSSTCRSVGNSSERRSQLPNQEEVYKINYNANVKWMGTQGLM